VPRTDGRSSVCFQRRSLKEKTTKKRVTVAHQLPCEHKSQSQKVRARNKQPLKGETQKKKKPKKKDNSWQEKKSKSLGKK